MLKGHYIFELNSQKSLYKKHSFCKKSNTKILHSKTGSKWHQTSTKSDQFVASKCSSVKTLF